MGGGGCLKNFFIAFFGRFTDPPQKKFFVPEFFSPFLDVILPKSGLKKAIGGSRPPKGEGGGGLTHQSSGGNLETPKKIPFLGHF